MASYILQRVAGLVGVILAVSLITFFLMHSIPGGPFDEERQPLPAAAKANILRKYGLDKPVWQQYLRYMWHAIRLDFGIPYQSPSETVTKLIARVWPVTIAVGSLTAVIAYTGGLLLGILAAWRHNTRVDYILTFLSTLGVTIPNFVIAVWLVYMFSIRLRWFPTGGWGGIEHLILPVVAYALQPMALVARYTRVSVLEAMTGDYVQTARSKGLRDEVVLVKHVLKNALIPLITVLGPELPNLLTGSIFIEATFRIPGLGKFFVTSIFERDYPMIMAVVLIVATLWSVTYLVSDLLYVMIDPRVRYGGEKS